eukprot:755466-Hanusia_phi.AAC.6
MDVSHTVNHLSFGPFLSETAWVVMPPDIAQAVGSLDDKKFVSEVNSTSCPPLVRLILSHFPSPLHLASFSFPSPHHSHQERTPTVWEHYVKVVKNVVELPRSWGIAPVEAHGYVVHTNKVQRYAEVPTARINYDILPIIVHVSEAATCYKSLTGLHVAGEDLQGVELSLPDQALCHRGGGLHCLGDLRRHGGGRHSEPDAQGVDRETWLNKQHDEAKPRHISL